MEKELLPTIISSQEQNKKLNFVLVDGSRLEGSMKDLNYEMPDLPGNQEIANKVIDIFENHARKQREMEAGIYESAIR